MKKKIGFVSMDSVLAQWLLEKLIQEPPESECAEDLLSGIHDMLSGEATSLLLSTSKEAESSLPPSDEIRIGALEIYPKSRRVRMQGAEVSLTPKEFDCLAELLRAGGAPVSSKALFENVWDEEYTSSSHNAVMVYIRRLRKKLAEDDSSEELIETVWGVGYRIPEKRRG